MGNCDPHYCLWEVWSRLWSTDKRASHYGLWASVDHIIVYSPHYCLRASVVHIIVYR